MCGCIRGWRISRQREREHPSLPRGTRGTTAQNGGNEQDERKASHFLGGLSTSDNGFGGLLNNTEEGRCSKLCSKRTSSSVAARTLASEPFSSPVSTLART